MGVFFLFLLIRKPIGNIIGGLLTERQRDIAETAAQVETTQREMDQLRNDYRQRLEHIEDETERRMAEAIREAEDLREQILAEAHQVAAAIVQRGQDEVERERAKARVRLRNQFVDEVIDAAEYAVGRSLDAALQKRLLQNFMRNVRSGS
jgi:F-type H+-transporting ATPase subunit b